MIGICPQLDALVANHAAYERACVVGRAAADEFFAKFDPLLSHPVHGPAIRREFAAAEQSRQERAAGIRPTLQLLSPTFVAALSGTRRSPNDLV